MGWASRPPVIASREHELEKDRFGKMPKPAGETPQTLAAGQYTAIVRGVDGGTEVGSVEVYQLP